MPGISVFGLFLTLSRPHVLALAGLYPPGDLLYKLFVINIL
jgi:hypothetical protein